MSDCIKFESRAQHPERDKLALRKEENTKFQEARNHRKCLMSFSCLFLFFAFSCFSFEATTLQAVEHSLKERAGPGSPALQTDGSCNLQSQVRCNPLTIEKERSSLSHRVPSLRVTLFVSHYLAGLGIPRVAGSTFAASSSHNVQANRDSSMLNSCLASSPVLPESR